MGFLHKIWWTPTCIRKLMALQGIRRPSYVLNHGNANEISNMAKEVMSRPKNLSNGHTSVLEPHIHGWTKIYGIFEVA